MDRALLRRVQHWMFQEALPFWADTGLDKVNGGVVESLALDGKSPSGTKFKRARVAARQLYVFSHAELLGWSGARAAADHVFEHFLARFWQGPEVGWLRSVTFGGEALNPTPDLYDYAFALFALAWRYRVTGDQELLDLAHATLDFIETRFVHPNGRGFHAVLPAALPRQQNPHMHLLEAGLVLAEATNEERFKELCERLIKLFYQGLFQEDQSVLLEFFDDDWRPAPGEDGRRVEPGHHFEWVWLLCRDQDLRGGDHRSAACALLRWAETKGVNPTDASVYNAVRVDGTVIDAGSRSWPNTERLKAWLAAHEFGLADVALANAAASANLLLDRYLAVEPRGCWIDLFDDRAQPAASVIPTSTLYHVFLAFAECLRVGETLVDRAAQGSGSRLTGQ